MQFAHDCPRRCARRCSGFPSVASALSFSGVPTGVLYGGWVDEASNLGLMSGCSGPELFDSNDSMTRTQMSSASSSTSVAIGRTLRERSWSGISSPGTNRFTVLVRSSTVLAVVAHSLRLKPGGTTTTFPMTVSPAIPLSKIRSLPAISAIDAAGHWGVASPKPCVRALMSR